MAVQGLQKKMIAPDTQKKHYMRKGSLQKIKPLFCDKCHKPGGGPICHKKNNHISKSFSTVYGGLQFLACPKIFSMNYF